MTVVALTVAGSDSGGGAGIQADLKTFQELGVFGTSALTAVTAQNTLGVHGVYPIGADAVAMQIRAVLKDFDVKAVKTGMLFSAKIIDIVTKTLKVCGSPTLVIDPVMIAKGGASLLLDEAVQTLKEQLIPMATIITPNIPEAEVLTGMTIKTDSDVTEAAQRIIKLGAKAVVLKGGHRKGVKFAEDLFLCSTGEQFTLRSNWINTTDTHGTGCTFSAAITAHMAQGNSPADAVIAAKHFIQAAIANALNLGSGHGPTNHWAYKKLGKDAKGGVFID